MPRAIRTAVEALFADVSKSSSALRRVLKPSAEGSGTRVYPAKTAKNDAKYGVRLDKGEVVHGTTSTVRLKLQVNSNAGNKSLADLAKKNAHKVFATADVDSAQDATQENLDKVKQAFLDSLEE